MVRLMKFEELRKTAALVGVVLDEVPIECSNLYVLVDPDDVDVYVGKAASKDRHLYEDKKGFEDYLTHTYSGFVATMYENETSRHSLYYDSSGFDSAKLLALIAELDWAGPSIDSLCARLAVAAPSVEEIEQLLIRIHVRSGRLIVNSQFASQWEGPIGSLADSIAAVAVHGASVAGILEMRHM